MRLPSRLVDRLAPGPRLAVSLVAVARAVPIRRLQTFAHARILPLARRIKTPVVVGITGGGRMLVDPTDVTGRMLIGSGVWEPHVTAVFRELLSPRDVCVDIGASIGYFTVLASRLVGQEGHVYAFEPAPEAYAALRRNVELNGLSNVTAQAIAVGAAEGVETLYDPWVVSNVGAASMLREPDAATHERRSREPVSVPVRPLGALVAESDLRRARLIKIDVEGYEIEVLRGLEPVYERGAGPAIVVEVHPTIAQEAPAFVADFCGRFGLAAQLIVDRPGVDRGWAASHMEVVDLTPPEELLAIESLRYEVLLRPT